VRGLPDAALDGLRALPAAASVAASLRQDGVATLHIRPRNGAVPVEAVVELATAAGAQLLAVQVLRPSLEARSTQLTVTVEPFAGLDEDARAQVEVEAAELARFRGAADAAVAVTPARVSA
jgi:hypothetical protein